MVVVLFAGSIQPALAQAWGTASSGVSGWVRDTAGAPQFGALVQLITPDARIVATAITDMRGYYRLKDLQPGKYRLRATQALFLPAQRDDLKLTNGARTVVDLTLATLFVPSQWLPAQRRGADESGDDWMWTLRSSANRPMLRLADDGTISKVGYSSSGSEEQRRKGATQMRLSVTSDASSFAHGGMHQTLTMDHVQADGVGTILRADISGARTPYPVAPSADVSMGYQHKTGLNGYQRTLLSYHSHPELVGRGSVNGMQAMTLRSGQRFEMGDTVMIDAGSMLREINMAGNAVSMLPFVRVSVKPSEHVVLTYGYATTAEVQSLDDLDSVEVEMPVAIAVDGHLRTARGSHHTVSLTGHAGRTVMEIALYSDTMRAAVLSGIGVLNSGEIAAGGVVADPTTQSFRALSAPFHSYGYRVLLQQGITPSLTLNAAYETGNTLAADGKTNASVQDALATLRSQKSFAATVALNGRILRTGTKIRAAYRWQPETTLTPVDGFHSYGDAAYFGVHLRQSLRMGNLLPAGLDAVVDVTNLLEQGYQPFISSDGRILYFAQSPKVLQAGLSFTF
jgi:hypothetical protein